MQISLKWVQELVNLQKVNLEDLINKLTLGGFEVEEVLEIEIANKKVTALDISATANRSDSLSIRGLSLEIASLLNQTTKGLIYSTKNYSWIKDLENLSSRNLSETDSSLSQTDCSGFIALTVENLNDFTSPQWLKQKLIASGISPENNLIDFQNYITIETGYPIEIYDSEQINSNLTGSKFQFHLTNSTNSNSFVASNDIEYKLDNSVLMITANDLPISIAGIIPSKLASYSTKTKSIIVEGSVFTSAKIRQESRLLGLRTDRSSRYEKSLKNISLFESLYRFISLLRIANPNLICKLHTLEEPLLDPPQTIVLNYSKIKQVLGPISIIGDNEYEYISPQQITDSLKRLQFELTYDSTNYSWQVRVPRLRTNDISQEIDLIEEIGRIYGFNNFLTRLPRINKIGVEDFDYQTRKKLTSCLINLGLNELIQYSLVNKKSYLENEIELINPLVKDYSCLRSSLLPNLIGSIEENSKKGNPILEGFEYGHVFSSDSSSMLNEIEYVAGVFGGIKMKSNWSSKERELDWFEAKGKIDQLFQKLNINILWESYNPNKEKQILHPYRTAQICLLNKTKLGIFGQISPFIAKKLNIPVSTYLFEFNFELIKDQIQNTKLALYQEYPVYPRIVKDLSFIIKDDISFKEIKEVLYLNGSEFLKDIYLLDEYRGESIPEEHISLCLQLVFQSNFKTLETKEVDMITNHLLKILKTKFNLTSR